MSKGSFTISHSDDTTPAEREEINRLLMAAPDLLAELITAQETLRTGQGFIGSMMDNSMSAAIAKAKAGV